MAALSPQLTVSEVALEIGTPLVKTPFEQAAPLGGQGGTTEPAVASDEEWLILLKQFARTLDESVARQAFHEAGDSGSGNTAPFIHSKR